MTLAVRNNILRLGVAVSILVIMAYIVGLYYIATHIEGSGRDLERLFVVQTAAVGGLGVFAVVVVKLLSRYFRKTTAPEVFFFLLCLLLLVPDMLKPAQLILAELNFAPVYPAVLTRVLYASLSFGVFSFFSASLFVAGIEHQRSGLVLAVAAAVSIGISYVLPVDSLELGLYMVHRVGFFQLYRMVLAVIAGLTVLNFLNASLGSGSRDYVVLAGSAAVFLVGRLWGFWSVQTWELLSAGALVLLGALVFGIRCYNMYLWK